MLESRPKPRADAALAGGSARRSARTGLKAARVLAVLALWLIGCPGTAWARMPISDLAWLPPATARVYSSLLGAPLKHKPRLLRQADPTRTVLLGAGEALVVPIRRGDQLRVEADASVQIGFGSGYGETPDTVAWQRHAALLELRVPTFSSARFLVVRGLGNAATQVRVWLAAPLEDPLAWHRADELVHRWLSSEDRDLPELPTALAPARPLLSWLAAARQALSEVTHGDEAVRWLQARWLEASLQHRPLYRPYFGPQGFRVRGGRPVPEALDREARSGVAIRTRQLGPGSELTIDGEGIDVVSLLLRARANGDTVYDVYAGSELVSRQKVVVPERGWREGWLGARLIRVVPPTDGRVRIRITSGRAIVTVRAYQQVGGLFDGGAHDRRHLLRRSDEAAGGRLVSDLIAVDRSRARSELETLTSQLDEQPAGHAARALILHELIRHERMGPLVSERLRRLWSLTAQLAPALRWPLRQSALAQLEAVATGVWDDPQTPWSGAEPAADESWRDEQQLIEGLKTVLAPERDGRGPMGSLALERWAAQNQLARDLAGKAWSREAPYRLLQPLAAPVVEKLVQLAPDDDEADCDLRGSGGQRWLALSSPQTLSLKAAGGTHTRLELRARPGARDQDAAVTLDGLPFAVHAGARLSTKLAATPGKHTFVQQSGEALVARFASDERHPCRLLFEPERWVVLDRQAAFELPSGHGWTELAIRVDSESLKETGELSIRLNGNVHRATFRGSASGVAQFWVEPEARQVVLESNQRLLVQVRVRRRRTGWPAATSSSAPSVPNRSEAEWLEQLRLATRQLRATDEVRLRDGFRYSRIEALQALGYERWARVDRDRLTSGAKPEQQTASLPFGALRLRPGTPQVVALGPLPEVSPLPQPAPAGWFSALLDADAQGAPDEQLLALLEQRSADSGDVDALLLATLAEQQGELADAASAWLRIWHEHATSPALAQAARLTAERAALTRDLNQTFDAYALAVQAREAGADIAPVFGRMKNSVRWQTAGAEQSAGVRLVEQLREDLPAAPLSVLVRRNLTDAPDGAVLLGSETKEFALSRLESRTVQVAAVCHALDGDKENCPVRIRVDGQRVPCRPHDAASRRNFERRRLDPDVARPLACRIELSDAARRLSVGLVPSGGAAVGWALVREVFPDGLGPSQFVSRWLEADSERPVRTWLAGPVVLRVTTRSEVGQSGALELNLQGEGAMNPDLVRELPIASEPDPNGRLLHSGARLTREARHHVVVAEPGRYRLTLAPRHGRALVKLEVSQVIAPPAPRSEAPTPREPPAWRVMRGAPPRLAQVGWDEPLGPLTLGASLGYHSEDLREDDQQVARGYAEIGVHARRAFVDNLLWGALELFDRERVGPASQGGMAGVWLTSRDGWPGAYARAELATQVLDSERAVGGLGVLGVHYPWMLRSNLKLVPVGQLVVRYPDEAGRGREDVDPNVYSRYAETRPYSPDLIVRLDHRPFVDTLLQTGLRVRASPTFEGVDRLDFFANGDLLAGTGWAPWLRLETLASYRPVSPQRSEAFTRFVATPALTLWRWVTDAQRLSLQATLSYFVDVPREAGRESQLSGQLRLSYDYTSLRGLRDFALTERPFRARLEEGLTSRRRLTAGTHPYWAEE